MVKDFLTWLDATTDPNEGDQARLLKELLADRSGALWQAGTLDEARTIVERYAQEKQSPVLLQIFDAAIDRFEQLGHPHRQQRSRRRPQVSKRRQLGT